LPQRCQQLLIVTFITREVRWGICSPQAPKKTLPSHKVKRTGNGGLFDS
jgi:hypothetical protein